MKRSAIKAIIKRVLTLLIISAMTAVMSAAIPGATKVNANYLYPHFLSRNEQRYATHHAKNPGLPYSKVISLVNANADLVFYEEIETAHDQDSITILLNKNFILTDGFRPDDLESISSGHMLRAEAAEQFIKMREEMISLGYRIHLISTYRSHQTQQRKHAAGVASYGLVSADRQYARAGHSEHQTGLAIDILHRSKSSEERMSQVRFETTSEYAWLRENAHNYGFILRYPREYRHIHGYIFEPWHWRFVGVDVATAMRNEGITLYEEYYGRYLAPGVDDRQNAALGAPVRQSSFE